MEIANPLNVMSSDKVPTHNDLIRLIRLAIASEIEAIQIYTQIADSVKDKKVIEVMNSVADEERVHIGEFMALLNYLEPSEERLYQDGKDEVNQTKSNFNTILIQMKGISKWVDMKNI